MSPNRRMILGAAGALILSTAKGSTFVRAALASDPRSAWKSAGSHPDARVRALSYAILAPNPHNRQPWLAELPGDNEILVRCELERRLLETDPFDRQITIGFGCFLELLRMAAAADGWTATIKAFPDGVAGARLDARPVAHVRFSPSDRVQDPLFSNVLQRRSSKQPYDMARAVPPEILDQVRVGALNPGSISSTANPEQVRRIRDITWRGFVTEAQSHGPHMESINLIRIGRSEVQAHPDGISLDAPMFDDLAKQADATRGALADPLSPAYKQMLGLSRGPVDATPAYLWLVTPSNTRRDQLDAGRDWVRINLASAGLGLGLHPQSATLQEYPEMDDLLREVHRVLGIDQGRVQMIGRVGYTSAGPPSPRWPVETRIRQP